MYIVKILKNKKIHNIAAYNNYENALSDIVTGNRNLFYGLKTDGIAFNKPKIFSCSENDLGFACDFEFRYKNNITACIEAPLLEDEKF